MNATINRIVRHLHQLEALDAKALEAVEMIVKDAIDLRTAPPSTRTLEARLRKAHPNCGGGFVQQRPHGGKREWRWNDAAGS